MVLIIDRHVTEKDVNSGGTGMVDVAGWAGWAVSGVTSITSKLIQSDKSKVGYFILLKIS